MLFKKSRLSLKHMIHFHSALPDRYYDDICLFPLTLPYVSGGGGRVCCGLGLEEPAGDHGWGWWPLSHARRVSAARCRLRLSPVPCPARSLVLDRWQECSVPSPAGPATQDSRESPDTNTRESLPQSPLFVTLHLVTRCPARVSDREMDISGHGGYYNFGEYSLHK